MRNRFRQICATILAFLLFISVYFHPHMTLAESSEDGMYDTYDHIPVFDFWRTSLPLMAQRMCRRHGIFMASRWVETM